MLHPLADRTLVSVLLVSEACSGRSRSLGPLGRRGLGLILRSQSSARTRMFRTPIEYVLLDRGARQYGLRCCEAYPVSSVTPRWMSHNSRSLITNSLYQERKRPNWVTSSRLGGKAFTMSIPLGSPSGHQTWTSKRSVIRTYGCVGTWLGDQDPNPTHPIRRNRLLPSANRVMSRVLSLRCHKRHHITLLHLTTC